MCKNVLVSYPVLRNKSKILYRCQINSVLNLQKVIQAADVIHWGDVHVCKREVSYVLDVRGGKSKMCCSPSLASLL